MNLTAIDWKDWLSWKLSSDELKSCREPLLQSENYISEFSSLIDGIYMITTELPQYRDQPDSSGLMVSTRRRLWDAMDWLSLQYSAGANVKQIAVVWPHALTWAEEYGAFHESYHRSPKAEGHIVPHAALRTEDYWIVALRLVCFGLLTGHAREMPRVMKFLDYGNEEMNVSDGLLERLVAPFVRSRPTPPDTCTRHLPYRKLLKVFAADKAKRPALMAKYLDDWYEASRREPYFDQHDRYCFCGYWSWEAAAVTWLLNIDDSSYRDKPFYPRDLVDNARVNADSPDAAEPSKETTQRTRIRIEAGQPCPQTGYWLTPAQSNSRHHFKEGDNMPHIETDYGATIWQWDSNQS